MKLTGQYFLDKNSGYALSQKHMHVAQILADYDPQLRLQWIPPDQRFGIPLGQEFRVVVEADNGDMYSLFTCSEDEVDHRLIARVFEMDGKRHKHVDKGELNRQAKELLDAKAWEESLAEKRELVTSILKSPLHAYRHDGIVYR